MSVVNKISADMDIFEQHITVLEKAVWKDKNGYARRSMKGAPVIEKMKRHRSPNAL